MRKLVFFLIAVQLFLVGCQFRLKQDVSGTAEQGIVIDRYDRVESMYLKTGDYAALQQMTLNYPDYTRMLIEDLLQLGHVNEDDIYQRLHTYYQDSTLKELVAEVERQYSDLSDVGKELNEAFKRLQKMFPEIVLPVVYTQIGSLDQSIVVGDGTLGISLDKYLGSDYPLYVRYGYTQHQRQSMTRSFIVPDCIGFYLLSLNISGDSAKGDVRQIVNKVMQRQVFPMPK